MTRTVKSSQNRIRIKDIAEMSGVSIGTVDRVLHNRGEVNRYTYDRVMTYVKKLGYTPNLLAKSLALKKNFTIATLIPDAGDNNPYWDKPLAGISRARAELKDFNTRISVYNYDAGKEKSFIRQFDAVLADNPDGIVLAPHFQHVAADFLNRCAVLQIPVILIDTDLEHCSRLSYFGQDAWQSGEVAARLMHYSLPAGSRLLVLKLAWNKAFTRHLQLREKGFLNYFKKNVRSGMQTHSMEIDLSLEDEPDLTLQAILTSGENVGGIFVTNSRIHKVAQIISKIGRKKIFLIGYDLTAENLSCLRKGLIDFLICQKPEEQGYNSTMAMFNYLLNRKTIVKINYSPIDIIVKENVEFYLNNNNY
jgi:LacI family transcriptional regulator